MPILTLTAGLAVGALFPAGRVITLAASKLESAAETTEPSSPRVHLQGMEPAGHAQTQAERERVIERMLKPSLNGPASPQAVKKLKEDLSVLPIPVLKVLDKHGVKIVITRGGFEEDNQLELGPLSFFFQHLAGVRQWGESLLDAGVFEEVRPGDFSSPETLEALKRFQGKLEQINQQHDAQIGGARERIERTRPQPPELTLEHFAAQARLIQAYNGLHAALDHALEDLEGADLTARRADAMTFALGPEATLANFAKSRGARNSEEISEYLDQVARLNPAVLQGKETGVLSGLRFKDLGASLVVFPHYFYATQPKTGARLRLSAEDFRAATQWDNPHSPLGVIEGMYDSNYHVIFLREGQLGHTLRGNNISVHEVGHAYEDAVKNLDPDYYETFQEKKEAAMDRAEDNEQDITRYAATNEDDFLAEGFAACFARRNSRLLEALDSQWHRDLQGFIRHASRLVK